MLELVFDDDGAVRRMPIRDGLTLGRSSDNDIVLRDFSVSRHHARVAVAGATFRIVDLKSTNGVKINGSPVADGVLQAGDRVEIGSFRLTVSDGGLVDADLAPTTYVRPLSEFNRRFGLEGSPSMPAAAGERERVYEIIAQVAKTLIQAEDLPPVLDKVMDVVFEHLPVDRAFIVLFDDAGEPRLELFRTRDAGAGDTPEVPISRTILDTVTRQKVAVLTHDAQTDERFEDGRSIRIHQIRSAMCAPLWLRDLVIGVIFVDSPLHVGSFSASGPRPADRPRQLRRGGDRAGALERADPRRSSRCAAVCERYHSPAVIEAVLGAGGARRPRGGAARDDDPVRRHRRLHAALREPAAGRGRRLPQPVLLAGGRRDLRARRHPRQVHRRRGHGLLRGPAAPGRPRRARGAQRAHPAALARGLERAAPRAGPASRSRCGSPSTRGRWSSATSASERRVDYTVLGNTVNVAARLEEYASEPGQIIIGETTHAAVRHLFSTEHVGDVQLPGLSRAIAVYRVALDEPGTGAGDA